MKIDSKPTTNGMCGKSTLTIKFFDYISSGLPVLNNYPGWLAEMIDGNELGKVIQPDHAGDFAAALVALSSDAGRLEKMGKNARAFAEKEFDRRTLAHQFEQALVETIENFNH